VLKTKGYNLEHNFGHGKQHLATVLAIPITTYLVFQSWDDLLGTLAFNRPPPLGP
jgi:hypothetical protein